MGISGRDPVSDRALFATIIMEFARRNEHGLTRLRSRLFPNRSTPAHASIPMRTSGTAGTPRPCRTTL